MRRISYPKYRLDKTHKVVCPNCGWADYYQQQTSWCETPVCPDCLQLLKVAITCIPAAILDRKKGGRK